MALQPRGIRNHNPGNIRWQDEWQGLVKQSDRTDRSFCQFTEPKYGIRALAKVILNYTKRKGMPNVGNERIDTVREIISRWAPPNENDTELYIQQVAKAVGVAPNDPISVYDRDVLTKLVKAIIKHENGQQPYTDELISKAISLAIA
ncbi:capsid protein [Hafnia phage yong3]|nr:capsid protein [Hafnia phage yong3]